jgi:hypothetical protein
MVGTYTLANFHFAADGSGGTLVTDPPAGADQSGASGTETAAPVDKAATVSTPETSESPISSNSANNAPHSTDAIALDVHLGAKQIVHTQLAYDVVDKLAAAGPAAGRAATDMSKPPGQTETLREQTGPVTLDHLTSLVEQISKLATTESSAAHSGPTTLEALHQDSSTPFQFFNSSMDRSASFKFSDLGSTDPHVKLLAGLPSTLTAQQDGNRASSISGDQFVFKTYLGSSDHGTIVDFGSVQSKTYFDYVALSANDGFNAWLSNDATVGGLNSGNHPSQDLMLSKHGIMAQLHASDFILPNH